ncbi:MAG: type II toxin-antitoxin system PrlF family antitoxin [Alphaproteobacteria bacterium]|nr:type II toxin-antitoxin system PrlF family antitoxin [Alphaproteobacteria bacterium]
MVVLAKLTSKGQATIPEPVRKKLKLKAGDRIAFSVKGDTVTLRRAEPMDAGFLKLATESFADWNTKEAEEDFRDF